MAGPSGATDHEAGETTAAEAFGTWQYLAKQLADNPDCDSQRAEPRFVVDVLRTFSYNRPEEDDGDERGPSREKLQAEWRQGCIDALTVHVISNREVNIMVPLAPALYQPAWTWTRASCPHGHELDATWLARAITDAACEHFKLSTRGQELHGARQRCARDDCPP